MERETQLKREREEKEREGVPCGRDRVEKEADGQVQDGATAARGMGDAREVLQIQNKM